MAYDAMNAFAALPHSLEAEQALLGILLYDNAALERFDGVTAAHFFEPFHAQLWDRINAAIGAGQIAEPILLDTAFSSVEAYQELGGIQYLADLYGRAPPAANAGDYARAVKDLALRRDLIRVGGELGKAAQDFDAPAVDHLATAEGALYGLAERGEVGVGIVTFSQALDGALDQAQAAHSSVGTVSGVATELIDLDQKIGGLHPSDLIILAGRPSMGKTALATNIAFNAAKRGKKVLFDSLEMSAEQLVLRLLAETTGIASDRIRKGETTVNEIHRLREAGRELRNLPLHIDATGGLQMAKLAARARRHKRRYGLDLLIVDYLQLVTVGGKSENRVQEVSAVTMGLKALAKDLDIPVIALSQLSRKVEEREDKRPQLSDLRESGSIEQDADMVWFVYREAYYVGRSEPKPGSTEHMTWQEDMDRIGGLAEVIIAKQRHGPIGTVKLAFDSNITKFGNLAREHFNPLAQLTYGGDQ